MKDFVFSKMKFVAVPSEHLSQTLLKSNFTKAQKKLWGFNRIQTLDICNTDAMLSQLSYEALLEAGQEQVQFVTVIWRAFFVTLVAS